MTPPTKHEREDGPIPERGTRLYQIKEDDLASLERILPEIVGLMYPQIDNRLRVQIRQVQKILSDVRWNYGPPGEVIVLDA